MPTKYHVLPPSRIAATALTILATLAPIARAEEAPAAVAPEAPQFQIVLSAGAEGTTKAKLQNEPDGAKLGMERASFQVEAAIPVSERFGVALGLSAERTRYRITNGTPTLPMSARTDTRDLAASGGIQLQPEGSEWTYFGAAEVRTAGGSGTDLGDGLTGGFAVGALYRHSETLSLGVGLAVQTRLEDDTLIAPLPLVVWSWEFAPHWRLGTGGVPSIRSQSVLGVSYEPSETFSLSFDLGADYREYRLRDDARAPGGVGRDSGATVLVSVEHGFAPGWVIRGWGGAVVWRELELLDAHGHSLGKRRVDPAQLLGFSVSRGF